MPVKASCGGNAFKGASYTPCTVVAAVAGRTHSEGGKILDDTRGVLLLLLGRVGVVETHDHLPSVKLGVVLVQQARLHVSDMQVARRLWGESSHDLQ